MYIAFLSEKWFIGGTEPLYMYIAFCYPLLQIRKDNVVSLEIIFLIYPEQFLLLLCENVGVG